MGLQDEYLHCLYVLKEDYYFVIEVVRQDGVSYHNLELFKAHIKRMQKIVDKILTIQ